MKKLVLPILVLVVAFLSVQPAHAFVVKVTDQDKIQTSAEAAGLEMNGLESLTIDEFLDLTPKQIRQETGEKLNLKEIVALKAAQKAVKKELRKGNKEGKPKSQLVALLLVLLVGGIGIHRFYLGYTTIGIIQLLTLGGCGVWALIDLIRIVMGDLGPADGSAYDPTL
ncbi:MAG: TM2 domain-containing protein [Phaeodactylibacter sp.]|uniref:TM2 domain-containing protein n=1 Tax=Phaeodactylibacter sp. TaxID=1940289 RepID=UPI0032EDAAB1